MRQSGETGTSDSAAWRDDTQKPLGWLRLADARVARGFRPEAHPVVCLDNHSGATDRTGWRSAKRNHHPGQPGRKAKALHLGEREPGQDWPESISENAPLRDSDAAGQVNHYRGVIDMSSLLERRVMTQPCPTCHGAKAAPDPFTMGEPSMPCPTCSQDAREPFVELLASLERQAANDARTASECHGQLAAYYLGAEARLRGGLSRRSGRRWVRRSRRAARRRKGVRR